MSKSERYNFFVLTVCPANCRVHGTPRTASARQEIIPFVKADGGMIEARRKKGVVGL